MMTAAVRPGNERLGLRGFNCRTECPSLPPGLDRASGGSRTAAQHRTPTRGLKDVPVVESGHDIHERDALGIRLPMSFWAQDRGHKVVSTATEDVRREIHAWPNTSLRRHGLPTFGLPCACMDPRAAPMAPTQQNGVQSGVHPMAFRIQRSRPRGVERCRRGPDVYVPYVLRASVQWSCSPSQVSERRTCLHPSSIPSDSRCPRAVRCLRSAQRPSSMSPLVV
eukprot:scaffold65553_cov92-Phaeocystis_antarctica.AAC.2